jgi:cytochrome c6
VLRLGASPVAELSTESSAQPSPSGLKGPAPERQSAAAAGKASRGLLRSLLLGILLLGLSLLLLFWGLPAWGASDPVVLQRGGKLFANHCAGCHVNGGNVIRRSKTLRRQDLLREGVTGPAEVARIAAQGKGQMSGYEKVLGEGGADAVGAWVWRQAELGWPRR